MAESCEITQLSKITQVSHGDLTLLGTKSWLKINDPSESSSIESSRSRIFRRAPTVRACHVAAVKKWLLFRVLKVQIRPDSRYAENARGKRSVATSQNPHSLFLPAVGIYGSSRYFMGFIQFHPPLPTATVFWAMPIADQASPADFEHWAPLAMSHFSFPRSALWAKHVGVPVLNIWDIWFECQSKWSNYIRLYQTISVYVVYLVRVHPMFDVCGYIYIYIHISKYIYICYKYIKHLP